MKLAARARTGGSEADGELLAHDPLVLLSWFRSAAGYASVTLPAPWFLDDDADEDIDEEDDNGRRE